MHKSRQAAFLRRLPATVGMAVIALMLAACASTPVAPTSSLEAARNAIASAEQSDARQYAGGELDEASRKLAQAERAVAAERMNEAEHLAHQSRIAAELAMARTAAAKAAEVNRQMGRDADALNEEMKRMGEQR
ncbi:DUF4398 domain-containing protein [Isoalcanivorax indicus]|uniref:DUF4398 domain-containing protein n=1 Tax=Isoalcanivorax indicus TaxID=2202653 RepID=UPI0013C4755F|nr:DUF4398 domain-containing protein [Isoalcanivorax indicus]